MMRSDIGLLPTAGPVHPGPAFPKRNWLSGPSRRQWPRMAAFSFVLFLVVYGFRSDWSSPSMPDSGNNRPEPVASNNLNDDVGDAPLAIYSKAMGVRTAHFSQTQTRSNKFTTHSIPPLVHMIWLGPTSPPGTALRCRNAWQQTHPDWHVLFWDESNANHLVRTHFPDLWVLYAAMPKMVMRSDWLRAMLLSVFGGIYADVDACPLKPFAAWDLVHDSGPGAGVVLGVEMDTLRADWRTFANRAFQIASWTLVAITPGHPLWTMILHDSVGRVQRMYDPSTGKWWANVTAEVCESTGPAVVTDVALQGYMARFGDTRALHGMQEARRFGDAVLLPITSFAPHAADMGAKGSWHEHAYVHHAFTGTWKGQ